MPLKIKINIHILQNCPSFSKILTPYENSESNFKFHKNTIKAQVTSKFLSFQKYIESQIGFKFLFQKKIKKWIYYPFKSKGLKFKIQMSEKICVLSLGHKSMQ